jgi:hypothetical protein
MAAVLVQVLRQRQPKMLNPLVLSIRQVPAANGTVRKIPIDN